MYRKCTLPANESEMKHFQSSVEGVRIKPTRVYVDKDMEKIKVNAQMLRKSMYINPTKVANKIFETHFQQG